MKKGDQTGVKEELEAIKKLLVLLLTEETPVRAGKVADTLGISQGRLTQIMSSKYNKRKK